MAYRVGILDEDESYQKAVFQYCNTHGDLPIQMYAFTNIEAITTFLQSMTLDAVLVSEGYKNLELDIPRIVLTQHRTDTEKNNVFYRYQSMKIMLSEIIRLLEKNAPSINTECRVWAVYSPLGRCGKTAFARALVKQFPRSIYVNWEGYSSEKQPDERGTQILYCIKSKNAARLSEMLNQTELPAPRSYMDLHLLDVEDLEWLKEQLQKQSGLSLVVFDLGTMVLADLSMLRCFDRVFIPRLEDADSLHKLEVFRELIKQEIGDEFEKGLQYLEVLEKDVEQVAKKYV
ncbi:MAG: hypothetical protein ACI4EK_02930 [Wujia sp.]